MSVALGLMLLNSHSLQDAENLSFASCGALISDCDVDRRGTEASCMILTAKNGSLSRWQRGEN